ncbi:MAG: AmmeMemoRadiSam system protein B [Thioalkalispiraceae bacterium]|jgi:AmmeMemoRadiSam system protein B
MNTYTREPAVAGAFYPADAGVLKNQLDHLLTETDTTTETCPRAIIAPHAGYIYSGPVAAPAYHTLIKFKDQIKRVVLLGPSHRVAVNGLALTGADFFSTPLGTIPIDQAANRMLALHHDINFVEQAHLYEHSLEVHLPFLQTVLDDFILVPIVVGDASPDIVATVLEELMSDDSTFCVVSTDLSHFHDYTTAQKLDSATSQAIVDMNYKAIGYENACGRNPLNGVLFWAKMHHYKVKQLDLRNSGDTAGTKDRVVGYGSYVIS